MTLKKIINLRSRNGHYTTRVYTFENNLHYERWYDKMIKLNYKITGIYEEE